VQPRHGGLPRKLHDLHLADDGVPIHLLEEPEKTIGNGKDGIAVSACSRSHRGHLRHRTPPAMVAAMRQMLLAAKVDEDDVRTEEFSGY
jgi:hypothetical protein